jgi:hypothetical protein
MPGRDVTRTLCALCAIALPLLAAATAAAALDPLVETKNYAKTPEAAVDPDGDGNMFSFYHRSRLDITRADGTRVDCEDLRAGCGALTADDGYAGGYAYAAIDRSPDR